MTTGRGSATHRSTEYAMSFASLLDLPFHKALIALGLTAAVAIWPLSRQQTARYLEVDEVRREQRAIPGKAKSALERAVHEQSILHLPRPLGWSAGINADDSPLDALAVLTRDIQERKARAADLFREGGADEATALQLAGYAVRRDADAVAAIYDGAAIELASLGEALEDARGLDFRLAILDNDVKRGYWLLRAMTAASVALPLIGVAWLLFRRLRRQLWRRGREPVRLS